MVNGSRYIIERLKASA